MLKLGEYEMWEIRIKQYFQIQDYALWELRFENDATKKTQKALLKQQYENFNATSSESLDSIFNRLQKLNGIHMVVVLDETNPTLKLWVWSDLTTILIVEQKVKRTVAVNNDDKNLAFLTTSSPSSTNTINTANTKSSIKELEGRINIDESSSAGYYKSKVEIFHNSHKMDILPEECRTQEVKTNRHRNPGSSSKAVRIEDASEKAMCAIDGGGFIGVTWQKMKFKQTWLSWHSQTSELIK
ncbi:hypothetical protein Tco_0385783 [Tanacetum coccineum]